MLSLQVETDFRTGLPLQMPGVYTTLEFCAILLILSLLRSHLSCPCVDFPAYSINIYRYRVEKNNNIHVPNPYENVSKAVICKME